MLEQAFRWLRRGTAAPSRIESKGGWWVDEPSDPAGVFEALHALLPADSVLALEGPKPSITVQSELEGHVIEPQLNLRRATLFPRSELLHLRFDEAALSVLIRFAATHDLAELCDHIYAYKGEDILVEWHDASTGNGLVIASSLDESRVRAFARQLGVGVEATPV